MPEQFPKRIIKETVVNFSVAQSGLYSISIIARCQSKEDLRIEIDDIKFREIPEKDKPQYNNIPPSWNGTELKGLVKTNVFILKLGKGEHRLKFIPITGGTIDEYKVERINSSKNVQFDLEMQAQDGDRRPWYTFILMDLPLKSITSDITAEWHFLDSDDVKLIIDNQVKKNSFSILHRNWIWAGSILRKLFNKQREEKTFNENLNSGIHYIEFWADKTPTIHTLTLNLGEITLEHTPTVDDPEWTGDFTDDSDQMILARAIFGEARDQQYPDKARIAVGWSIRNRVEDSRWPDTYVEVITQPLQYSAFNEDDPNRKFVENPFHVESEANKTAWHNCYDIAGKVISGEVDDPANGANHYYDDSIPPPYWATKETFILTIKRTDNKVALVFHKL